MKKTLPLSLQKFTMKRGSRSFSSYEEGRQLMDKILFSHGFSDYEIPAYINIFLQSLEDRKEDESYLEEYSEFFESLLDEFDSHNLNPETIQDFIEIAEGTQEIYERK